jgi:hypothetical protein
VTAPLVSADEADPVGSSVRTKIPRPSPGSLLANGPRASADPVPAHRTTEQAVTQHPVTAHQSAAHQGEDTP